MKIENFEKAKEIKEKIDALQQQLDEVKEAIEDNKTPEEKYFQLSNFGTVLLKWEHLDWRKMLFETETTLCSQIASLKFQFETLD
jgi:chaperonin cofactor prefoldin